MIGGNIEAAIQVKQTVKNEIGEGINTWVNVQSLHGWLDMLSGQAKYGTYNAKIEDSSHVFICDYVKLHESITNENTRAVINNKTYDVTFIDNPMELNQQLEIYLQFIGGK